MKADTNKLKFDVSTAATITVVYPRNISVKVDDCYGFVTVLVSEDADRTEQPKQYKYEKADYAEPWRALRDLAEGQKFYRELDGKYYEASNAQEVLSLCINNALLVKVEVTQKDLEAQRAEELAKHMRDNNPNKSLVNWTELSGATKADYLRIAKSALEWMKQDG